MKCPIGLLHLEFFDPELSGFYVDVLRSGRKSYRLRYRDNKILKVVTLGNALNITLKQARVLAKDFLLKVRQIEVPTVLQDSVSLEALSIEDFFNSNYLPFVKSYKRSWSTDVSMVKNHIVPKLGSLEMGKVKPPDIAVFLDLMKTEGYAFGTCNRALVMLRYGFELALKWKIEGIDSNPLKDIKNLVCDNKIERYLSTAETQALMDSILESENEELQFIVLFLIYTGARKREVMDANWGAIDWLRKSWRIPKTKSGKIRHVPLSNGALEVLEKLKLNFIGEPIKDAPIFPNPRTGKPYVNFYYSWNNARKRAGLNDFRIHDLRHSFASSLVNAGRSLYEVQELLGHADIKTTSRYAHLSRERLIEAVHVLPHIKIGIKLPFRAKPDT
jgi:integrase